MSKAVLKAFLIVLAVNVGCMLLKFPAGVLMHPCSLAVLSMLKGKLIIAALRIHILN